LSNSNVRLGDEAVERVMALLHSKIYWTEKVYTNKFSPDLKCIHNTRVYGIEVKSLKGVSGGKIGRVFIDRSQWNGLVKWCDNIFAIPYAIFEIKGGHAGYLYRFIKGDLISEKMGDKGLSLTAWQIIKLGEEDFK